MIEKIIIVKKNIVKLYLSLLGSIVFVVSSIFLIITNIDFDNFTGFVYLVSHYVGVKTIGIVGLIFFGMVTYIILKRIFLDDIALKLAPEGIYQNDFGWIVWRDILSIEEISVKRNKFIAIYVNEPNKYIDRIQNRLLKKIAVLNNKFYRTPIHLIPRNMKMDYNELLKLLKERLNLYKNII